MESPIARFSLSEAVMSWRGDGAGTGDFDETLFPKKYDTNFAGSDLFPQGAGDVPAKRRRAGIVHGAGVDQYPSYNFV